MNKITDNHITVFSDTFRSSAKIEYKMIKRMQDWLLEHRLNVLYAAAALAALVGLYTYKLGSFVPGNSYYESREFLGTTSLQAILHNIIYAPMKLVEWAAETVTDKTTILRLTSSVLVIATIIVFYRLILKWHTSRIAILTTVLFALSSYSLHLGRFTIQDALYFLFIPTLLLFGTWLKSKRNVKRMPIIFPVMAIFLYLPGVLYILLALMVLFRRRLQLAWSYSDPRKNTIAIAASTLMIVPLIYSLLTRPSQLAEYFGVDRLTSGQISAVGNSLVEVADSLFYRGPDEAYRWLVGTPILDIGSVILLILGVYSYWRGPHTLRARLLLLLAVLSLGILSLSSVASIALLIPLIYIVLAGGLVFLLQSWFTVFPRNPAARNTAIVLIAIFVTLICSYHAQRYFIAWPNAPETKAALERKIE